MKNQIAVALLVFCAGCGSNDVAKIDEAAKIDALENKLDAVLTNQTAILDRINALPTWINQNQYYYFSNMVSIIPRMEQINSSEFYYHTNAISLICDSIDLGFKTEKDLRALDEFNLMESVSGIKSDTRMTLGLFTNGALVDIGYTRLKLDDVGHDVRVIKAKLGVFD